MATFANTIVFANPTALTAAPASLLEDGMFYVVSDHDTEGTPAFYQYKAASSATLDSPAVLDVTNGSGRFIQFAGGGGGGAWPSQGIGSGDAQAELGSTSVAQGDAYLQIDADEYSPAYRLFIATASGAANSIQWVYEDLTAW